MTSVLRSAEDEVTDFTYPGSCVCFNVLVGLVLFCKTRQKGVRQIL